MKPANLILTKVFKFDGTRCQILSLKCTKFNFGCGSAPDPAGELTALPRPLARFRNLLLREGKGIGGWG